MSISISSPPSPSQEWTLVGTLAPSGVSTIDTATLAAYDVYKLVMRLTATAAATFGLRLNADAGTNYAYMQISNTAITEPTAANNIPIASTAATALDIYAEVIIHGKTTAVASGTTGVSINSTGAASGASAIRYFQGSWTGGNATQVTTATVFIGSGTFTGKIDVYAKNLV